MNSNSLPFGSFAARCCAALLGLAATLVSAAFATAQSPRAVPSATATGTAGKPKKPVTLKPLAVDGPRQDFRSQNFFIHTDMTAEEAQEQLERLEYMLGIISTYWGKPLAGGPIECYIAKDLNNWPGKTIPDDDGRASIERRGGLTIGSSVGAVGNGLMKAVVFAPADRGVPQHESVHAYCFQTFGTSGPTWYSEGMAEMGQYWKKNESSVQVHEGVAEYIRESPPKTLNEIVNGNERTGDSWQNYAWRWALCHLLAVNPNYAQNFRPLGLGILNQKPVSFEQAYGHMANEISFEYLLFLKHVCNGYRMDLCWWDWKRKFTAISPGIARTVQVQAARGYQPTGVLVKPDVEYEIACTGTWKLDKAATKGLTADGDDLGEGKLVGVVFKDFQISEEFDIGATGKFKVPSDGQLHVRCKSDWGSVGDNVGTVTVKISVPK